MFYTNGLGFDDYEEGFTGDGVVVWLTVFSDINQNKMLSTGTYAYFTAAESEVRQPTVGNFLLDNFQVIKSKEGDPLEIKTAKPEVAGDASACKIVLSFEEVNDRLYKFTYSGPLKF